MPIYLIACHEFCGEIGAVTCAGYLCSGYANQFISYFHSFGVRCINTLLFGVTKKKCFTVGSIWKEYEIYIIFVIVLFVNVGFS